MALVLILLTALVIFVVAAVAVGRVAHTSSVTARQAVFDLDEAVDFVADRLPYELQARLSHDDVRAVLGWYLDELEASQVAYERDQQRLPEQGGDDIVLDEQHLTAQVIGRCEAIGMELSDVDVLFVLEEGEQYLRAIGALGREAG
jgi:hypothetical protein